VISTFPLEIGTDVDEDCPGIDILTGAGEKITGGAPPGIEETPDARVGDIVSLGGPKKVFAIKD
jgi:hypothetical protein